MPSMNDFHTREAANNGIEVPLFLPDGTKSEHFLVVRGIDSDEFRQADAETKRNAVLLSGIEGEAERNEFIADSKRTLIASLIADWSFEEECTPQNIKSFLKNAPQIADQVDTVAAKRSLFFGKRLSNSENLLEPNSSSTESPTDQK